MVLRPEGIRDRIITRLKPLNEQELRVIEYYTFKHKGNASEYLDEVYLTLVPNMTVAMFYGSKISDGARSQALLFSELLNSDEGRKSIDRKSVV